MVEREGAGCQRLFCLLPCRLLLIMTHFYKVLGCGFKMNKREGEREVYCLIRNFNILSLEILAGYILIFHTLHFNVAHYSNQFSLGRALTKQCPYCSSKALHLSVHAVVLGKSDGSARGEHHSLLPSLAFSAIIVTSSYQKIFRNRKDEKADEKTTTLMSQRKKNVLETAMK